MKDLLRTFGTFFVALFAGLVAVLSVVMTWRKPKTLAPPPAPPEPPPPAPALEDVPVPAVNTAPSDGYTESKSEASGDTAAVIVNINERHK